MCLCFNYLHIYRNYFILNRSLFLHLYLFECVTFMNYTWLTINWSSKYLCICFFVVVSQFLIIKSTLEKANYWSKKWYIKVFNVFVTLRSYISHSFLEDSYQTGGCHFSCFNNKIKPAKTDTTDSEVYRF